MPLTVFDKLLHSTPCCGKHLKACALLVTILSLLSHSATHSNSSSGTAPEIDEVFPVRPTPVKQGPQEEPPLLKALAGQTTTGAGFFTPDVTVNTNLFRGRKNVPQAFRMDPPPDPRDPM